MLSPLWVPFIRLPVMQNVNYNIQDIGRPSWQPLYSTRADAKGISEIEKKHMYDWPSK